MEFFYQAGAMGYHGEGYAWHHFFNKRFPNYPIITKTITRFKTIGFPFAVLKFGETIWNKVSLHNPGLDNWYLKYKKNVKEDLILSIHGSDPDIQYICDYLDHFNVKLKGIELNYSCPNVKTQQNKKLPKTKYKLYLKLNCYQDPYCYDLSQIERIHLNSIPKYFGGISGGMARKDNWAFIEKFIKEGLNVAGCSAYHLWQFKCLEYMGCKSIGIGSVMLSNPDIVPLLRDYKSIEKG